MIDSKLYVELKNQLLNINPMVYIINCYPADYLIIKSNNFRLHQTKQAIMVPNSKISESIIRNNSIPRKISTDTHSLTKTSKVVIRNNLYCENCKKRASYVFECKYKDKPNDQKPILIFTIYEDGELILLTKDHIKPKALGGTNGYENLQCLCENCNLEKGHRYDVDDMLKCQDIKNDHSNNTCTDPVIPMKDKIKHFKRCRRNIKSAIDSLPWYYKILGVDKYIYNKLKKPLIDCGYYHESIEKEDKNN